MKSFFGHLAFLLILLAVLAWFLFPVLSDQYDQAQRIPLIERFEQQVKAMDSGQSAAIEASWKQYNESITSGTEEAPKIETVNGLIAVLEIPGIGVRLPVYPSTDSQGRNTGVVHNPRSSLPTGENRARTVLVGNNGRQAAVDSPWIDPWLEKFQVLSAQLLHRLDQVKQGSMMYLYTPCGVQAYEVVETIKTQSGQMRMPEGESAWLVVMTSLGGQERQLVYGRLLRLAENAAAMERGDGAAIPSDSVNVLLIGSPVLLVGMVFMLLVELIRRWHYRMPADSKKHRKAEG